MHGRGRARERAVCPCTIIITTNGGLFLESGTGWLYAVIVCKESKTSQETPLEARMPKKIDGAPAPPQMANIVNEASSDVRVGLGIRNIDPQVQLKLYANMAKDAFFSFNAPRQIAIVDRKVGLLNRIIQAVFALYLIYMFVTGATFLSEVALNPILLSLIHI